MRPFPNALRIGLTLLLAPAALAAQGSATHFDDVSAIAGVEFSHQDGAFSYAMGGGAAWFDIENDGDPDLFTTSSTARHALYRYNGVKYVNIIHGSGIAVVPSTDTIGVIAADYNQDGFVDLFLTNTGPNQLYRNNGNGTFTDVAPELGLDSDAWSTSASWADFDRDGDLDLYVGNYIVQLNFPYHIGEPNLFYLNVGTATEPVFAERAESLGIDDTDIFGPTVPGYIWASPEGEATAGCTLSVCTLDFDEDGDQDLMVGNDFGLFVTPNKLYRNDTPPGGTVTFTDITYERGYEDPPHYNMGINPADYDHDGDWDFYMSNLGDNPLMQDDGTGNYQNVVYAAGPVEGQNDDQTLLLSSWGTVFRDFDNDGWEDLAVGNGLIPAADFILNDSRAENHLWLNQRDGTFVRVDPELSGMNDPGATRGLVEADVNNDGWLDLYTMNNGAGGVGFPEDRCRLYLNNGTLGDPNNGWLKLHLRGRLSNLEGIGTRIDAFVGDQVQKRQVLADPIFISSPSRIVHFGLGLEPDATRLELHWPSGVYQELHRLPGKAAYDVIEPIVTVAVTPDPTYVAETLNLSATLANQADVGAPGLALFQLRLGEDGPVIWTSAGSTSLDVGGNSTVTVGLGLPQAIRDQFVGIELEARIFVTSVLEGWDMRSVVFGLP